MFLASMEHRMVDYTSIDHHLDETQSIYHESGYTKSHIALKAKAWTRALSSLFKTPEDAVKRTHHQLCSPHSRPHLLSWQRHQTQIKCLH